MKNTTIDSLRAYGLQVIQPRNGYRFSLDPLLLCNFVETAPGARISDLGTGCGIIPLILSQNYAHSSVVGIEFQEEMAQLATSNIRLNGLQNRIEIICDDIIALRKRFTVSSFDLVVANPPYRTPGSGRISPRSGRDLARHESSAGLADFLTIAKYLVRPRGHICFIYPPSRLSELICSSRDMNLAITRLRMVHDTDEGPAKMFLAELAKSSKRATTVLAPLIIRGADGEYTRETARILGEQC